MASAFTVTVKVSSDGSVGVPLSLQVPLVLSVMVRSQSVEQGFCVTINVSAHSVLSVSNTYRVMFVLFAGRPVTSPPVA